MNQRTWMAFGTVLVLAFLPFANADESEARTTPPTSYVLLQNGNVLQGTLQESGNRIVLTVERNSKIYLERKQVEFIGSSLETLYQHQCAGIRVWGTGEHWHLAHWCIQQGMLDHAIKHYKAVESLAADSPRFKELEHLLREALLKNARIDPQKPVQSMDADASADTKVVFAGGASESQMDARSTLNRSKKFDAHEIPSYVRKSFHTGVVPILVSRCGQSGCHGLMGKSNFHIYQPVGEQSASLLAKDLEEVLRYVDRENLDASPLVSYATKAHGIQRNPSFNASREEDRMHLEKINLWMKSLIVAQPGAIPTPAQFPPTVASSALSSTREGLSGMTPKAASKPTEEKQDRNAKLSKPAKSASSTVFLTGSEIADLEAMIERLETKQAAAKSKSNEAKDPFDPDIFNKKFR